MSDFYRNERIVKRCGETFFTETPQGYKIYAPRKPGCDIMQFGFVFDNIQDAMDYAEMRGIINY